MKLTLVNFAIMFNVEEGGIIEAINWGKENFRPDRSIIIIDEPSLTIVLWHGTKQGIVNRRIALRQAESLKGHGYTVGKTIIGRTIRRLIEIDQRKIGRDPETDQLNADLDEILNRRFESHEGNIVTFGEGEIKLLIKEKGEPKAREPELEKEKILIPEQTTPIEPEIEEKPPEPQKKEKISQKVVETDRDISDLIRRIENLEKVVGDVVIRITNLETNNQNIIESTPSIIKDLRIMQKAIKNNKKIPDTIEYPTREEFVKEKIDEVNKS